MNIHLIRQIILEQVEELFVDSDAEETALLEKDSVDDQIDSFLIKFEKESIVKPSDAEVAGLSESFTSLSLRALLEQAEDVEAEEAEDEEIEDADETEDAEEEEEEVSEPAGSEDVNPDVEANESVPKIPLDMDAFTKRVARLAMNYDVLLDVKTTIVNRAMNFLLEHYNKEHVSEMKEILDTQFDFDLGGPSDDPPPQPYAAGAWAGGTGGLGGGGA
tara:strand:+ start:17016 stop:17669 length:654 start_codon:yes stop_codon:yes gene_type:complete